MASAVSSGRLQARPSDAVCPKMTSATTGVFCLWYAPRPCLDRIGGIVFLVVLFFRDEASGGSWMMGESNLVDSLANNGWVQHASVRRALTKAGLPVPDRDYLTSVFGSAVLDHARSCVDELSRHFSRARFAAEAVYAPLLVPDPARLDTRSFLAPEVYESLAEITEPGFVDPALPPGVNAVPAGADWALFVTITSEAGLAMGSFENMVAEDVASFMVKGTDTRRWMIRQLWGALVLQRSCVPDSEKRKAWTFTLFPGEGLVAGQAVSGTVLHGQVRFRLGKTTRGIRSVRVRSALFVAAA